MTNLYLMKNNEGETMFVREEHVVHLIKGGFTLQNKEVAGVLFEFEFNPEVTYAKYYTD